MRVSDDYGVVVKEETTVASRKSHPDQPALDKIDMLSDWTAVNKNDYDFHDEEDVPAADLNVVNSMPNAGVKEPDEEPVSEDAIIAGSKVAPRTSLLGDEPYGKLTATGPQATEEVIMASETSVAMRAAPRTSSRTVPDDVDQAAVAPSRRTVKADWIGQAARSDEFSWLVVQSSDERRASVDSLDLPEELITPETSTRVECARPLPVVSEDTVTASRKSSTKFDVDFNTAQPRATIRVVSESPEVTEDQIQTFKVSTRKLDDFLVDSKIEFTARPATDSIDDSASLNESEGGVPESEMIHPTPVQEQFASPHVEEESVVRQTKKTAIVIPEFPTGLSASLSVGDKTKESPTSKKSGIFGFFGRKSKNRDHSDMSPDIMSNSLDKRSSGQHHEVEDKSGSTLPADIRKEKSSRGDRFHIGHFGFGGKNTRGASSVEEHSGTSPRGQSPRTNSSGESAKSPSKTNIRVFEIMAGRQNDKDVGVEGRSKEQPITAVQPPASVESTTPSLSSPITSVSLVRPPAVVDVHVSAPVPPTVPAFSSQYMVAVAIDFGLLPCFASIPFVVQTYPYRIVLYLWVAFGYVHISTKCAKGSFRGRIILIFGDLDFCLVVYQTSVINAIATTSSLCQ